MAEFGGTDAARAGPGVWKVGGNRAVRESERGGGPGGGTCGRDPGGMGMVSVVQAAFMSRGVATGGGADGEPGSCRKLPLHGGVAGAGIGIRGRQSVHADVRLVDRVGDAALLQQQVRGGGQPEDCKQPGHHGAECDHHAHIAAGLALRPARGWKEDGNLNEAARVAGRRDPQGFGGCPDRLRNPFPGRSGRGG